MAIGMGLNETVLVGILHNFVNKKNKKLNIILLGGFESMSNVPFVLEKV